MVRQIDELMAPGIIEISTASCHSQVHLVPTSVTDKFCMYVDYRYMNSCTEEASWPIPGCYVEPEKRNLRFLVQ